ncbi:MarR family winged helix-turn-helix transcriptional regulator [Stackebrandtia nassauensis]|uniref:Transcriptional regulator, MarR family n=1 Tax=Stackebrandtia nassauensis (strain DSM 44728 / CIP 108903 / NRRL B-16338 / NBRC 102104 / LLR-40K-21) TaxID=446470 RepID=D3PZH2_STANL|nr:MarR family transcriptional regulator [Stackebrandtia nassauensis]ADD41646.1 transcriptional regulator, MarR family [Stackebrandtia nassauensis DSM 44728]
MAKSKSVALSDTATFQLGTLGAIITERFAAEMTKLDLKPKHVGVLNALSLYQATSQLELARLMGVAPSLLVALADHLEEHGAIERVRDAGDRRRQVLALTESGRALLDRCAEVAAGLETELLSTLTAQDRDALRRGLRAMATGFGLRGPEPA